MSCEKKSNFAQIVQKSALRAKEKLLVNLGKVDKTKDELFDDYIANFNKQQLISNKLNKDLKSYINATKEKALCETALCDTIKETYENEWINRDQVAHLLDSFEFIWSEYLQKVENQVIVPLNSYNNQFLEIKEKINKRSRKLLYYDSARHNYDTVINGPQKKKDDTKITKALEQLMDAKKVYQELNSDLNEALPALYQSRISFIVSNFQSLFAAEFQYHNEVAKIYNELSDLMEKLAEEAGKSCEINTLRIWHDDPPENENVAPTKDDSTENLYPTTLLTQSLKDTEESPSKNPFEDEIPEHDDEVMNEKKASALDENVLYKVETLHKYTREDTDELSFEAGEILKVIASDEQELDLGWRMGIKEDGIKGVFPENFTKKFSD